ncbi:MAG: ABC transporter permease [Planctomycetota bacterium]|jgi:ABC-type multidrug transport system permease subunit
MGLLKLGADAWHIATHDLRVALRQRETQLWTFLMPILFFWFIGTVTGGFAPSGPAGDLDPVPLDVHVEPGAGFVVEGLVARLEQSGFAVNRIDAAAHSEADPERLALFVPADLSQRLLAGEDQVLRFQGKSGGLFGEFGEFALQQAVLGTLGDLTALAALERPPSAEALAELREAPSSVTLDVRPARRDQRAVIPSGFDQAVPGTMVMFTLLLLLTSGASTWIIERREGVLLRLGAAPIQRTAVVLGKALGKGGLGAVQLTYAMVLGHLAFGVDWGPNLPAVALLLFSYAAFLSGLSLWLGNLAKNEGQAIGLGVLCGNVFGALGGCWWPIEVTPEWMQTLSLFLPTGWAMDGLHKLVSFGAPPAEVLPHVGGMLLGAIAMLALLARRLRLS